MRDADAAELQALIATGGQTAWDTLAFRQRGRRVFMRVGDSEWRVKAEPTPDRAGDLIVRTASGRTIIGAYPDDLTMT
jgi:hypothetical protein